MKILVTGGAGYIGSAIVRLLLERQANVFAYDDLSLGNRWSIPSNRLIIGNILDKDKLTRVLREGDYHAVIHCAALCVVSESNRDAGAYWQTNVAGTLSLLDCMGRTDCQRLLLASTAGVYGSHKGSPIRESDGVAPEHVYGITKVAAETHLRTHCRFNPDFGATAIRFFNAAGASQCGRFGEMRRHETHLIPLLMRAARDKKQFNLYGSSFGTPDGTCVRDYIHVDDLASVMLSCLEMPNGYRVYNAGCGVGVSNLELIDKVKRITNRDVNVKVCDPRPGDPGVLVADTTLLQKKTGWSPRYSIDDILATAWKWHNGNERIV